MGGLGGRICLAFNRKEGELWPKLASYRYTKGLCAYGPVSPHFQK